METPEPKMSPFILYNFVGKYISDYWLRNLNIFMVVHKSVFIFWVKCWVKSSTAA